MDFWDLVKLLWRRWYVTTPLLLVTIGAAGWIVVTVGPEYQATGYVTVVPPAVQRQAEAGQVSEVNPWNEEALADAARIRVEGKRLEDELAAAGYEGEWSTEITGRLPVIALEVVAPTADQAVEIMHSLQDVVEQEVAERQAQYDLGEREQYTTVRYDEGESVETTASRLRRTLVAVVGAGMVLTVAVVAAYDAVARWRRARAGASTAAPAAPAAEPAPPAGPDADVQPRRRYAFATSAPAGSTADGGALDRPGGDDWSANRATVPVSPAPVTTRVTPVGEAPLPVQEDSTVVLPLSNVPWAGRANGDRANGDRASSGDRDRSGEAGAH